MNCSGKNFNPYFYGCRLDSSIYGSEMSTSHCSCYSLNRFVNFLNCSGKSTILASRQFSQQYPPFQLSIFHKYRFACPSPPPFAFPSYLRFLCIPGNFFSSSFVKARISPGKRRTAADRFLSLGEALAARGPGTGRLRSREEAQCFQNRDIVDNYLFQYQVSSEVNLALLVSQLPKSVWYQQVLSKNLCHL